MTSLSTRMLAATLALFATCGSVVQAAEVPDFMKIVVANEGPPASKGDIAFKNIYALNEQMLSIYENSLKLYRQHFLERQTLIMALFSAKGGRFILYRPGQAPLDAPSPPIVYRMAKSVGHCAMATYDLVAPYVGTSAADQTWVAPMRVYQTSAKSALEGLKVADLNEQDRALLVDALSQVIAFMDKCLAKGSFDYTDLETYCHGIKPDLAKLITLASSTQVSHWYKVLEDWKKMLGKDWDNTYALSNSIYVARQNNILFSVLVQFMGEKAINDRLLLLETTDFTASPDDMLDAFMRIISDRALGKVFYGDYRLMDYELLGGGGRKAIEAEAAKRGMKAILPPLVPYNSTEWPWKIDPNSGTGPALMEQVK